MQKQYIEINAFINDLKSDKRYVFKNDPLYLAVVNETEKNLRAWAASEEAQGIEKIIRCEDCKYFRAYTENPPYGKCTRRNRGGETVKTMDYCSYAEYKIPEYDDHDVSGLLDD